MVQTAWKFAEAKKEKRSLNSYWCLQGRSHWSLSYEMFLLWAAVSEGEKVGGTSSSYLMSAVWIYPPVRRATSDTCFLWAVLWVLKDVPLERVGCPAQENCPRLPTWVLKEKWVRATGQGAVRNGGGNANKKLLKEINATNTGEINNALWQWHLWFACVVKAHLPYFAK